MALRPKSVTLVRVSMRMHMYACMYVGMSVHMHIFNFNQIQILFKLEFASFQFLGWCRLAPISTSYQHVHRARYVEVHRGPNSLHPRAERENGLFQFEGEVTVSVCARICFLGGLPPPDHALLTTSWCFHWSSFSYLQISINRSTIRNK